MSRIALVPKNTEEHEVVVCGLDHAMGWFFQLFGMPDEEGEDTVLIDKDQMMTRGFNRIELLRLVEEYAVDDEITRHCLSQIAADEDPAKGLPQRNFNTE